MVRVWRISGFCGDSHRFFCGYGMGMGIKIQSPRQPWSAVVTDDNLVKLFLHCHVKSDFDKTWNK